MEENERLNISIESQIANIHFDTLKICGLFYLLLFDYIKIFFPSCFQTEQELLLLWKIR